ncbi:MAG TPA: acireductone synthase [Thermoanaerobaculia bacterium]|nr:acireductone synthase [Thermoanaerobaculia bacterium]
MPLPAGIGGLLLDVEGTTTAIAFVYDVLFPYAAARLEATCARRAAEPEVARAISRLREEHAAEAAAGRPAFGDGAPYARWLMARDRKSTGLKALQGLIWEEGYAGGELRGHVFADVPPALAAWRAAGVRLRVFSSGSRRAQQLLFAHSDFGDLTAFFDGFHDTTTGPKLERSSYVAIGEAFALPPAALLFLSDTVAELDAAAAAGYRTGLLERPGNRPQPRGAHPAFATFAELAPVAPPGP